MSPAGTNNPWIQNEVTNITLITFRACPNAEIARRALRNIGVNFRDVWRDDLPQNHPWRAYSSPTILQNENLVFGSNQSGNGACSITIPTEEILNMRLATSRPNPGLKKGKAAALLSFLGSIGSIVTVGLCPVCIPAVGALLTAIGVGFLAQEAVLKPLLIALLVLTVAGLAWSGLKEHHHPGAFVAGVVFAVTLYTGRYVYFDGGFNATVEFIGMAGLIAAVVWNLRLRKQMGCSACHVPAQKE